MFYHSDRDYHTCPMCLTEVWPGDTVKERGEYQKHRKEILYSLAAQKTAMDSKPVLPPGEPCFKGGGKSGRKRKKPVKKDIRVAYET
jgi:hypothetical protein